MINNDKSADRVLLPGALQEVSISRIISTFSLTLSRFVIIKYFIFTVLYRKLINELVVGGGAVVRKRYKSRTRTIFGVEHIVLHKIV